MRIPTPIQALSAAAALALLAGCSSGSAIAPNMTKTQGHVHSMAGGRVPAAVAPMTLLKVNMNAGGGHRVSFNNCPATGTIEYISDFNLSQIRIYAGNFAGQAPCGTLTNGILNPQGMIVKAGSLYVADTGNGNILRFARGATTANKTYTDTINGSQFPVDVTVSADNTIIASNIFGSNEAGSLSTFNKTTGATEGNFPNAAGANTYFVTVQKNGTVYYDDNTFDIYVGSCPAGACGAFASTGATMAFPGGLRSADHEDVILQDQSGAGGGDADEYEAFPSTFTSCALNGSDPVSFDINHSQHHYFYADAGFNEGVEVSWSAGTTSCPLIGSVAGNSSGLPIGAAKDLPEHLN